MPTPAGTDYSPQAHHSSRPFPFPFEFPPIPILYNRSLPPSPSSYLIWLYFIAIQLGYLLCFKLTSYLQWLVTTNQPVEKRKSTLCYPRLKKTSTLIGCIPFWQRPLFLKYLIILNSLPSFTLCFFLCRVHKGKDMAIGGDLGEVCSFLKLFVILVLSGYKREYREEERQ